MNIKELLTLPQIQTLHSIYWQPTKQRQWNQRRGISDHSSPKTETDPFSAFNYLKISCLLTDQEAISVLEWLIKKQISNPPEPLTVEPDLKIKHLKKLANLQTEIALLKNKLSRTEEEQNRLQVINKTLTQKLNQFNELATIPQPITPIEFTPILTRVPKQLRKLRQ